ncbi:hypothetical protein [Pseudomonas farris]
MNKWKSALICMASLSLSACWNDSYEFEGKYFLTEGDECSVPSSQGDRKQFFLEIIPQIKDGKKQYIAKMPLASQMGAPISSSESSEPTDKNELIFNFSKPEEKGGFSGSPGIDMMVYARPNADKSGYIWIEKIEITVARRGRVKEESLVESLRKTTNIGSEGICLHKVS